MLMVMNAAKIFFPLITLPYLTRVLSTECYGIAAYVRAAMLYMQTVVDFGFMLSATKSVAESADDKYKLERIAGINIISKFIIAIFSGMILFFVSLCIKILRENILYTFLSYIPVVLTIFLFDFLFRGLERMHIITARFVIMKTISTILTFIFVKSDSDLLLIPVLDTAGSFIAVLWVINEIRKLGIKIKIPEICECFIAIKESSIYFISSAASTSFNVFNTLLAGIFLPASDVAYWSVCMQIIGTAQGFYIPVSDAVYPEMVRSKNITIINRIMKIFLPVIILGCVLSYIYGDIGLYIIGGNKYLSAFKLFRSLIPVLFTGFFSVIYGWPVLGSIGKVKQITITTITASIFQVISIIALAFSGKITLLSMSFIRNMTEIILFAGRFIFYRKYKNSFKAS